MIIQKQENSYIQRTYKSDIDLLPIQVKYYHHIDQNKDELVIHKREFKVLPKLKFIRGKDVRIHISDIIVERIPITIPYAIEKKTIMKDATKFQNDYIEYDVEYKVYDLSIKDFIQSHLDKYLIK